MSITVPPTVRRWLVPATAALAVIGGGVAIGLVTNAADPALEPRSAEELLVDLQTAQVDGLQGTVTLRADLGLPPLPVPSLGSADLGSLASGTHTLRVWYADPGQARVALLGRDSETDIIANGDELWIWSSTKQTAIHATLPEGGLAGMLKTVLGAGMGGDALPGMPSALPSGALPGLPSGLDPETLASLAVTFLEQFETDVTSDNQATVAGRAAYELTIAPRDSRALLKSIVIDIDAETKLPLRFAVLARDGGAPAFEVAFTDVTFTRPDPAQFEFNPPPGTTVVEADEDPAPDGPVAVPDIMHTPPSDRPSIDEPSTDPSMSEPRFATVGSGWTMVLAVRLPEVPDGTEGDETSELLSLLPTVEGDWGSGKVLETRLFSVLFTDDGRVLAGSVPAEVLYEAAADPATQLGS